MLPHKTHRGAEALQRLKTFEGIPAPYNKRKRMVVPDALKVVCLKGNAQYIELGELASGVGWNHRELIERLEAKRKVQSEAY